MTKSSKLSSLEGKNIFMLADLQVADLSIIKYGLLSNEGMTGYILKIMKTQRVYSAAAAGG